MPVMLVASVCEGNSFFSDAYGKGEEVFCSCCCLYLSGGGVGL